MTSGLQRFDFTLKAEGQSTETICEKLTEWCNKWVFQLEKSESGYEHFQGRLNMIKPKTIACANKIWKEIFPTMHLSPTNNACKTWTYVMKADTRIEGPWSDDKPKQHMTRQLAEFLELKLYPWQEDIITMAQETDNRRITVVLDLIGNCGKTMLCEIIDYKNIGYWMPPMTIMEDIMQCAMSIPIQKCYIIDLPKGMRKEKMAGFYAGLESLKNGYMYDKRYAFKRRIISRPQVIVFTNTMPDVTLLSKDRWAIYRITREKTLVSHGIEKVEEYIEKEER